MTTFFWLSLGAYVAVVLLVGAFLKLGWIASNGSEIHPPGRRG